jgi:soluble lytic murein transglycosylase-like protein
MMSHLLVAGLVVPTLGMTAAFARQPAPARHRIQITAVRADHPESFREIPADPPPPPKPRPVPISIPYDRLAIANLIRAAAARHGANADQMLRVAMCESSLNPNAHNASGASGIFQFKPATFYGHGGHNIWDPAEQADIAAAMFAAGLSYEWTCR